MSGTYIPVSGDVDANGVVLALKGLVSNENTLLVPPGAPTTFSSQEVQVISYSVTAELIASAGFPMLKVSGQANATFFVIDVMATVEVPSTVASTSPVATWVYGVGIRLGVRAIGVTGTAAGSYQGIAASATLDVSSTMFQFDGIGLGPGAMPLLKGLVDQSMSGFDVSTVQELGNVSSALLAFIASPSNANQLYPQVVGVIFSTASGSANPAVQQAAASYGWALRGIQKGYSAITLGTYQPKNLPAGITLDNTLVTNLYQVLVGSTNADPTPAQIALAGQLMNSGP